MPIEPDEPHPHADTAASVRGASGKGVPPTIAVAQLEHGFEVEGEKPRPAGWRPSVLVVSLIVGGLLAIAATLFEIF